MSARAPREGTGPPIRVFSIPGPRSTTQYVRLICAGLQQAGAILLDPRSWRVWTLQIDIVNIHFAGNFIAERGVIYGMARAAATLGFLAAVKTLARGKIVYTVHDVTPMRVRNPRLLGTYLRLLNHLIDGYMFLSDSSQAHFYSIFPAERAKPFVRIDHSSFDVQKLDDAARARHRASFAGDSDTDLLVGFLGSIKTYKGIDALPALPPALANGKRVRAVVAGPVEPAYATEAEQCLAAIPGGAIRIDRALSDEDLEHFIRSVDAVILPYTGGWNSGMAMLVLSLRGRLLLSDRPIFQEIESEIGRPWVYVFDNDPKHRSKSLEACLNTLQRDVVQGDDRERLADFIAERSFDRAGVALCAFYRRLLVRSQTRLE